MASSERAKTASTDRQSADHLIGGAIKRCLRDLDGATLAERPKNPYAQHITAYGEWLASWKGGAKAIVKPRARDPASRDFKRPSKVERGWKPASVNRAPAAVDRLNRFIGLGPANVTCEPLTRAAPRAFMTD